MQLRVPFSPIPEWVWELIKHDVPGRARHPLVFWLNISELVATIIFCVFVVLFLEVNTGLYWLLVAQVNLFAKSAWYHYYPKTRPSLVLDQTAISIYILAVPLPLVWHDTAIVTMLFVAITCMAFYKYFEAEDARTCNPVFMAAGAIALYTCVWHAEVSSGNVVSAHSTLVIVLYALKLGCNWLKPKPVPGYFEQWELGHLCFLLPAIAAGNWFYLKEQLPTVP